MRDSPKVQEQMCLVHSTEKIAEELGGGREDHFVSRDYHGATNVVITDEHDVRQSLVISELVEESLDIGFKVVVGKTKQRTHHHERTAVLKRGEFINYNKAPHHKELEIKW